MVLIFVIDFYNEISFFCCNFKEFNAFFEVFTSLDGFTDDEGVRMDLIPDFELIPDGTKHSGSFSSSPCGLFDGRLLLGHR